MIRSATAAHVVVTGADPITEWEKTEEEREIYYTPWQHEFITWTDTRTHPSDDCALCRLSAPLPPFSP